MVIKPWKAVPSQAHVEFGLLAQNAITQWLGLEEYGGQDAVSDRELRFIIIRLPGSVTTYSIHRSFFRAGPLKRT
jgi:hypothetical protein